MTQSHVTDVEVILDAAGDIIMNDGYAAVTHASIASRARVSVDEVTEMFPTANDAMVAMLNREFQGMYGLIVQNIERDPRGGLLSRIYLYILAGIYERPLSKTLFVIDRDALNRIMRHSHSFRYVPQVGIRGEMIERLQDAIPNLLHERSERLIASDTQPQRDRVEKKAERVIVPRADAFADGHPDDQFLLSAVAREQHRVGGEHQHGGRDVLRCRDLAQSARDITAQR